MQLKLRYDIGNGPVEISTNLYVVVQWERRFKRKASDMADGIGIEDLAYMAWEASKLHSVVVPAEFDSFIKKLQGTIEVIGEDDENPTQEAPTDTL